MPIDNSHMQRTRSHPFLVVCAALLLIMMLVFGLVLFTDVFKSEAPSGGASARTYGPNGPTKDELLQIIAFNGTAPGVESVLTSQECQELAEALGDPTSRTYKLFLEPTNCGELLAPMTDDFSEMTLEKCRAFLDHLQVRSDVTDVMIDTMLERVGCDVLGFSSSTDDSSGAPSTSIGAPPATAVDPSANP